MFGLLTGSQVARFALPAPEPPEGMLSPVPAPSMEPATSAQLQGQNHSLQPVSSEVAEGVAQTAQQSDASDAPVEQAHPGVQLPSDVPSSGQSAAAPQGAAQAASSGALPEAPGAAESASSRAGTASPKSAVAKSAYAGPSQAASVKPAEVMEPATQPTGKQQLQSAAASFSHASMRRPNEADMREQASAAETSWPEVSAKNKPAPEQHLQPPAASIAAGNEYQTSSQPFDSGHDIPSQAAEGLGALDKPQDLAQTTARTEAKQPASVPEPAADEVEVLGDDSASAQPAAEAAAERQLLSSSAMGGQHDKVALQSDPDTVHAPRLPIDREESNMSAKAEDLPLAAGTADGEQDASAASQADSAHPAAIRDLQQEQPLAVAPPAGMLVDAQPAPDASGDRKTGSLRGAAENGDSGHNIALSAPREAEQVQHGGISGSMPEALASAAPAMPSLAKKPVADSRKPDAPCEGADSLAKAEQETSSQEGTALTENSALQKGISAPAPQMVPSEAGSAEHGGPASAKTHKPAVEPPAPKVSQSGTRLPDDRASTKPQPKQADPEPQLPLSSAGREKAAMGAAASSGIDSRESAVNQPTQASSRNSAITMSKAEPPAGPPVRSTSASTAKQAPQSSAGSSVSKAAADPLQALLGETQPGLARPPPRLSRPLSSGPLPRQSTSSGAPAGEESGQISWKSQSHNPSTGVKGAQSQYKGMAGMCSR